MLPKPFDKQDTKVALFMAWILSPCILTLIGFYLGTIFGNRTHEKDLQNVDMQVGGTYALCFFIFSIVAAIVVTIVYPGVVNRDFARREADWAARGQKDHH